MNLNFNTAGTKMYILGWANDTVFEYNLSTAFDISTASYSNNSFSVSSQDVSPRSIFFNPDGDKMFMAGQSSDTVYQYSLSTNDDVSSASYDNVSFDMSSQIVVPNGLFFKNDGSKMYVVDLSADTIYQYST
jgi:sugar lactone lactonase YvrE